MQLAVIAKQPRPGFSKTRLSPDATPAGAAAIAAASLADTLAAVIATPASRHVLILDGEPGPWLPAGFAVVPQVNGDLGDRLAAGFRDCFAHSTEPVVLVGMDTPQLRPADLLLAGALLTDNDAVLGPASDGGYWLVGLTRLHPEAFLEVPMSADDTGARQHDQLRRCGYRVTTTTELDDVDTATDARLVAGMVPGSGFERAVTTHLGHRPALRP